jgi:hypothetical protein
LPFFEKFATFYDGEIIVDIYDFRNPSRVPIQKDKRYLRRIILRPSKESFYDDLDNFAESSNLSEQELVEFESKILLQSENNFCLNPSPVFDKVSSILNLNREKFNYLSKPFNNEFFLDTNSQGLDSNGKTSTVAFRPSFNLLQILEDWKKEKKVTDKNPTVGIDKSFDPKSLSSITNKQAIRSIRFTKDIFKFNGVKSHTLFTSLNIYILPRGSYEVLLRWGTELETSIGGPNLTFFLPDFSSVENYCKNFISYYTSAENNVLTLDNRIDIPMKLQKSVDAKGPDVLFSTASPRKPSSSSQASSAAAPLNMVGKDKVQNVPEQFQQRPQTSAKVPSFQPHQPHLQQPQTQAPANIPKSKYPPQVQTQKGKIPHNVQGNFMMHNPVQNQFNNFQNPSMMGQYMPQNGMGQRSTQYAPSMVQRERSANFPTNQMFPGVSYPNDPNYLQNLIRTPPNLVPQSELPLYMALIKKVAESQKQRENQNRARQTQPTQMPSNQLPNSFSTGSINQFDQVNNMGNIRRSTSGGISNMPVNQNQQQFVPQSNQQQYSNFNMQQAPQMFSNQMYNQTQQQQFMSNMTQHNQNYMMHQQQNYPMNIQNQVNFQQQQQQQQQFNPMNNQMNYPHMQFNPGNMMGNTNPSMMMNTQGVNPQALHMQGINPQALHMHGMNTAPQTLNPQLLNPQGIMSMKGNNNSSNNSNSNQMTGNFDYYGFNNSGHNQ